MKILRKIGSYVFTSDNFFKMIQILLRFKTGIPVLIMGETGCGKTSLINTLGEILDYKIEIFNVHSGISDLDIVRFLKNKDF